ncbi:MAG: hypothetical protein LBB08_02355 [Rickettsiales bacterium]|nr:hypothetical protein [Rickettsiales bacterium]
MDGLNPDSIAQKKCGDGDAISTAMRLYLVPIPSPNYYKFSMANFSGIYIALVVSQIIKHGWYFSL